jgi:DNA-binding beta-propeller fold protein YncE
VVSPRRSLRALLLAAAVALLAAAPAGACTGAECYVAVGIVGESPPTGSGVFRFPQAIAYTPGGSGIFVGDQYSGVVQRFGRGGDWQLDVGSFADAGQLGRIGVIGGLATDRSGHLFILDSQNDRVQVFLASTGQFLGAWGSRGTGPGQFRLGANTGAGGIAIDQPSAALAPVVYIADQDNDRVQAFRLERAASGDPSAPVLPPGAVAAGNPDVVPVPTPSVTWGSFGDCSVVGCTSPAFDQSLNRPQGIGVDTLPDAAGRRHVLVADDRNHRIVEYLPDGTFVRQTGTFGTGAGQFRFPYDVGVDARSPRQVYVADNNNHRVQVFDAASFAFVGGWGGFGPEPGRLEFTRALAALADDPLGGVAVADTANNRVQVFDSAGGLLAYWGIAGRGPGYVSRPGGVAVDASGVVHIADTLTHRLERLGLDGAYLGQSGYIADRTGFAAPNTGPGQFEDPAGVTYDPRDGTLWVADTDNHRVQHLALDGSPLATYGSMGAALGQLSNPRAVAIDPAGGIYVADTGNNRVVHLDPAAGTWAPLATGGEALTRPSGVAAAPGGTVYISDTGGNRILAVTAGVATPLGPPPAPALSGPTGLFLQGGLLYAADTGTSRILRVDLATGAWDVFGGAGTAVGSFTAPTGVATDPAGDTLVVADTGNDRIQRFTLRGAPPPATVRLDVGILGSGSGQVTSSPAGIACPSDCRQSFSAGSAVSLTATPASGSAFAGWGGACSGTGGCAVTMGAAQRVTATFAPAGAPAPTAARAPARSRRSSRRRGRPVVGRLRIRPSAFRAVRRGSPLAPSGRGARLRFRLSERATVTLTVRRIGRRGRLVRVPGRIRLRSRAGTHTVGLTGRLGGRTLRPGRYRLALVAVDAAGNRSKTRTVAFRIIR